LAIRCAYVPLDRLLALAAAAERKQWSLAPTSGLVPGDLTLDERTAATMLELARIAAHTSGARTNAPLLSYLAGLAVGQGAKINDLAATLHDLH
jgi:hypothetical protein